MSESELPNEKQNYKRKELDSGRYEKNCIYFDQKIFIIREMAEFMRKHIPADPHSKGYLMAVDIVEGYADGTEGFKNSYMEIIEGKRND